MSAAPGSVIRPRAPDGGWPDADPFPDIGSARTVAVVGNAPEQANAARAIDAADRVFRFNDAHGFGGSTGRRVTDLVLVNRGGAMDERLDGSGSDGARLEDRAVLAAAPRVILPINPGKDALIRPPLDDGEWRDVRGECRTAEAVARLRGAGKDVRILTAGDFVAAAGALGVRELTRAMPAPSTGFLLVHALLARAGPATRVTCHGFGHEGWEGHAFDREAAWFRAMERKGRIVLVPVPASPHAPATAR